MATMILTNTVCRKRSGSKQSNKLFWTATVIAGCLIAVILFVLSTGDVEVELGEDQMYIVCSYWPDKTMDYEKIDKVVYSRDWNPGKRVGGFGSFRLKLGRFENGEEGRYDLYAYADCDSYVVMHTDRGIVVVNGRDEAATRDLYEAIRDKLGQLDE